MASVADVQITLVGADELKISFQPKICSSTSDHLSLGHAKHHSLKHRPAVATPKAQKNNATEKAHTAFEDSHVEDKMNTKIVRILLRIWYKSKEGY